MAENKESLLFINIPEGKESLYEEEELPVNKVLEAISGEERCGNREKYNREEGCGAVAIVEYNSVRQMCPELDALDKTLRQLEMGNLDTLQSIVLAQLREPDFEVDQLAKWASKLVEKIGFKKGAEREALEGVSPDLLEFIGLGRKRHSRWKESKEDNQLTGPSKKRGAPNVLEPKPTKLFIVEEISALNDLQDSEYLDLEVETQSQSLTQLVITEEGSRELLREKLVEGTNRRASRRTWSWKREARSKTQRGVQIRTEERREGMELHPQHAVSWIFTRPERRARTCPLGRDENPLLEL